MVISRKNIGNSSAGTRTKKNTKKASFVFAFAFSFERG